MAELVSCSNSEGKKLCKSLKIKPEPRVLKHYKDGEFHKDYDRKESVPSFIAFMKDPGGDAPWEEDDSAQDIQHLANPSVTWNITQCSMNKDFI